MGNKEGGTAKQQEALPELPEDLKSKLEQVFNRFDNDGNGTIDRDEILAKFATAPQEGQRVAKLFEAMDSDTTAGVDKEEFNFFWRNHLLNTSAQQIAETVDNLVSKLDRIEEEEQKQSQAHVEEQLIAQQQAQKQAQEQARQIKIDEHLQKLNSEAANFIAREKATIESKKRSNRASMTLEKANLEKLQDIELPSTRQSVCINIKQSLKIEDDGVEIKMRHALESLDDEALYLQQEVAQLKASNDMVEFEQLDMQVDQAELKACIEKMAAIRSLKKKLAEAAAATEMDLEPDLGPLNDPLSYRDTLIPLSVRIETEAALQDNGKDSDYGPPTELNDAGATPDSN